MIEPAQGWRRRGNMDSIARVDSVVKAAPTSWRPLTMIMKRLLGLAKADAHPDTLEFDLVFAGESNRTFRFKADLSAIDQILAGLSRLALAAREKQPAGKAQVVSAEGVHQYLVKREPWENVVLLRLVNPHGVPYTFALPLSAANDIADRLKTESAKTAPVGKA
jgi:hypothetical protein